MTAVKVARRHRVHGRERSAFRNAPCLAVREQIHDAHLVVAGRDHLSYVLLNGWRVGEYVTTPFPPGSPEPPGPRFQGRTAHMLFALLLAASAALGSWLVLAGVIR